MNSLINNTCPSLPSGSGATNMFLTLLNALVAAKCSLDQSSEYPEDSGSLINDGDEFDFIIIGSGAGGSVVGYELSQEKHWRVLVLEAGGLPSTDSEVPGLLFNLENTPEDWGFEMAPNKNALLGFKNQSNIMHRGKFLGGSTSINFMYYIRGQDLDFDAWAVMGNAGWDWNSVLPLFLENENMTSTSLKQYYGVIGPQKLSWYHSSNDLLANAVYETAPKIGSKVLKAEGAGVFETPVSIYKGFRQNAAKSFLGSVKNERNLLLSYNSYVERIIIESKKARGVLVNIQGRKLRLYARKEVIVSGGVINSPQLLLLSGIGPKEDLLNIGIEPIADLPVGKNFHDHNWYVALFYRAASLDNYTATSIDDIYKYIMYRNDTVYGVGGTKITVFTNSGNSDVRENEIAFLAFPPNQASSLFSLFSLKEQYANIVNENNQNHALLLPVQFMVNPMSRGQITLASTDPYEKPVISLEYLQFEEEVERLLHGINFVRKLIATEPMSNLGLELIEFPVEVCDVFEKYSDDYFRCLIRYFTTSGYHQAGTCKMGNDSTAVVDSRLRVIGIDGLRVADASIMPQVTKGNTMAPTMMIGRKAGIMIREDWSP